ncbi:MAG TPA: ADP-ribosylglycohydrolase family protein [Phycisphaerae bacterium]|nr:ADP-ribosylglycohydrolase family protein [Phycisphaerae bacterium]
MQDTLDYARTLARDEILEMQTRGHDVAALQAEFKRLTKAKRQSVERYHALYEKAHALGDAPGYRGREPSDLAGIKKLRPRGPRVLKAPGGTRLKDKVLGGWLGRIAGCILGKPVEGWPKQKIEDALVKAREYPLSDYFTERFCKAAGMNRKPHCLRNNIRFAARDDDLDYTILGLHLVERHGFNFKPEHVAEQWLARFPYHMVYTAERVAYHNLVRGIEPPESASFENPYREWIGAQIRADAFGLVSPGMPARAAQLAFSDAALSHTANGIYGEMWSAATTAAAFSTDSPEDALRAGMREIPQRSRLYEALDATIDWSKQHRDWQDTWQEIMRHCGKMSSVHTINNAMIVAMALMHGKGNFTRTIGIAVMGGLDTDCNGATAGAMLGTMLGAEKIPARWYNCFHDELHSVLVGFNVCSIADLAERTYKQALRHRRARAGR